MTETSSKPFQSAVHLQSLRPTGRLSAAYEDASEARYWAEKFGLGERSTINQKKKAKFAHPRAVQLQPGTASIVHQIIFGQTAAGGNYRQAKHQLLAVACGPRVPLYGTTPQSALHRLLQQHSTSSATITSSTPVVEADRQLTTGGQLALAVALRVDGRLLAIGTETGHIRVADVTSRATLVSWEYQLPVRTISWFRDGQHLVCAGDDAVVRVLRIQKHRGKPTVELRGHGDAIRCANLWQKDGTPSRALLATGSYDHSVRLWNMDNLDKEDDDDSNNRCVFVLQHGAPVESLLWIKSSTKDVPIWLVSAGGTQLKVWNPLSGQCVCALPAQHRKTITSLLQLPRISDRPSDEVEGDDGKLVHMRLVTGGLDGLLRIHAWDSASGQLRYLHGISLGNGTAVTALAATFAGDRIAIGTTQGTVVVRQVGSSILQRKRIAEPTAGTFAFFTRGMNADPREGDHVVVLSGDTGKKRKLAKFDLALKQFRYGDALDEALETRMPQAVVAVIEELGKRRGLTIALSNRDEESLEPVLAFTVRYVTRPRFAALLIGVAHKLIDIYGPVAGQSETIDELFAKLKNYISEELRTQKLLYRVVGQIESIMTEAEGLNGI